MTTQEQVLASLAEKRKLHEDAIEQIDKAIDAVRIKSVFDAINSAYESNGHAEVMEVPHHGQRGKATVFDQVVQWFAERNNLPATLAEITEGTGCVESSVKQVLYKSRSDYFDRHSAGGGGVPTEFWLREEEGEPEELLAEQ